MRSRVEAIVHLDEGPDWWLLANPSTVVEVHDASAVAVALREVDALAARGQYAVGFVRYEAGAAFGLPTSPGVSEIPLVWFALFEGASAVRLDALPKAAPYQISALEPSMTRGAFREGFERIRAHIADGNTYQVNYTFKLRAQFTGDALSLFSDLSAAQRGAHGAFVRTGRWTICSASPELFFERHGSLITARPMKGTAPRGRFPAEDRARAERLRQSAKERAENVMIVDMVRNDLGRVADVSSVAVPELFSLERYPNVWQMTSTITARTDAPLDELFAAAFPSASVTGAPKHRTMEIIAALEGEPRGVYTGAIGCMLPGGRATFNVAIRTAVIDEDAGALEFGIGSGVVWDSDAEQEFDECRLKGSVLGRRPPPPFELLETMRWDPGDGFSLLERHLDRLRESAEYFDWPCPIQEARDALAAGVAHADRPLRVRLMMSERGSMRVEASALGLLPSPIRVGVAALPVDSSDVFLFHKTTHRVAYEQSRRPGVDDVLLWNEKGEITESTIANLVVERGGARVTPPIACGVLAGTFRAELLARGEIVESIVRLEELASAPRIWLVNSVRGWCLATLAEGDNEMARRPDSL